jgi:hypothetical protein
MLGRMGVDSLAEDCPDGLNCKETRLTINKPNKIIRLIENSSEYPFSSSSSCSSSANVGYNPLALRAATLLRGMHSRIKADSRTNDIPIYVWRSALCIGNNGCTFFL